MLAGAGGPPKQPLAAVDYMLNILPAAEQRKATGRLREEGSFPLTIHSRHSSPFQPEMQIPRLKSAENSSADFFTHTALCSVCLLKANLRSIKFVYLTA